MLMFDFHCHSLFSDGELLPSELVRRVEILGYKVVAITDHADSSNMDIIIPRLVRVAENINRHGTTKLVPGIELTHVHPDLMAETANEARRLGAKVVVGHGETIVEPVHPGTNRAALEADIDILAHPGLISAEAATLAAERGIFLELSGRKGHGLTNGHVAKLAVAHGASLIINSDGHAPCDFMSAEHARNVGIGAGLSSKDVEELYESVDNWLSAKGFIP